MQLQKSMKELKSAGIQVVAISYDSEKILNTFAEKNKIEFPLLSDPDSKTIAAFGILNDRARGRQKGVPHPNTFLIGKDGKVQKRLPGTVFRRHSPKQLIEAANETKE